MLIIWVISLLPEFWESIKLSFNKFLFNINTSCEISLWLLVFLIISTLLIIYYIVKRIFNSRKSEEKIDLPDYPVDFGEERDLSDLTDEEKGILNLLVESDGKSIYEKDISEHFHLPTLEVQRIMESLVTQSLIKVLPNGFRGGGYVLTREGRDLSIGNKYNHN